MKRTHYVVLVNHPESLDKHYFCVPIESTNIVWSQFKELVNGIKPYSSEYVLTPSRTYKKFEHHIQIWPNGMNCTHFHNFCNLELFLIAISKCKLYKIGTVKKPVKHLIASDIPNYHLIRIEHSRYDGEDYTFFSGKIEERMFKFISQICCGLSETNKMFAKGLYDIDCPLFPDVYNLYKIDYEEIEGQKIVIE